MYKTILVPLDGSKRAEAILPHVEEIAQRFTAKVIFIQVVEPYATTATTNEAAELIWVAFEQHTKEVHAYLNAWCGEFHEKGIEADNFVERGPVVEAIIDVAKREEVDLIAMASHGRSGLSRVFYGSVASGILH